jgi:tetratricopeptide (TPR) repeat protein
MRWPSLKGVMMILAVLMAAAIPVARAKAGNGDSSGTPTLETAAARSLSDRGLDYFKRGKFDQAIAAFQSSYELSPVSALLFNLAQANRKKGDCRAALNLFRRFAVADPEAAQQAQVSVRIDDMEACVRRSAAPSSAVKMSDSRDLAGSPQRQVTEPTRERMTTDSTAAGRNGKASGRLRTVGLGVSTIGLASLAVGVFATTQTLKASQDVSMLFRSGGQWSQGGEQLVARGHQYETLSKIMYAGGGVALAAGISLYYVGIRQGVAADIAVVVQPSGGAVTWNQRF